MKREGFKNLEKVNLSGCKEFELIEDCTKLVKISAKNTNEISLPNHMPNLQIIDLKGIDVKELPSCLIFAIKLKLGVEPNRTAPANPDDYELINPFQKSQPKM